MKKTVSLAFAAGALAAALSAPSFAFTRADSVGARADGMAPSRVVSLDGRTRWVNVEFGDVVQFVQGGKSFEWAFNGVADAVKLGEIAPSDFNAPQVTVYINQSGNPLNETSGGGE